MNAHSRIAALKESDATIQLLSLPAALLLAFAGAHFFALYLVAVTQCAGCFYWHHYFRNTGKGLPQMKAAKRIRQVFFIVMLIHGICLALIPLFFFLLIIMLFAGPVLGIAYFVITRKEVAYYKAHRELMTEANAD